MTQRSSSLRFAGLICALAFVLGVVSPVLARAASKLKVVTSTTDLAEFAAQVGGDRVEVETSPHDAGRARITRLLGKRK